MQRRFQYKRRTPINFKNKLVEEFKRLTQAFFAEINLLESYVTNNRCT